MTQTKRNIQSKIREAEEARDILSGVEPLGFHSFESNAQYHAIGVYQSRGKLTARHYADTFCARMPETAERLYLMTYADENAARYILAHYDGLPPVLQSLLERAVAPGVE